MVYVVSTMLTLCILLPNSRLSTDKFKNSDMTYTKLVNMV